MPGSVPEIPKYCPIRLQPTGECHHRDVVEVPCLREETVKSPVATVKSPDADEATKSRADYKLRIRHSDRKEDP